MVEWQTRRTQNAVPQGVPVRVWPRVSFKKAVSTYVDAAFLFYMKLWAYLKLMIYLWSFFLSLLTG